MNFVCLVFELGDKTLTLSPMENLMVKCNLHVWSYDFYDMTLSTGKQRRHMINCFPTNSRSRHPRIKAGRTKIIVNLPYSIPPTLVKCCINLCRYHGPGGVLKRFQTSKVNALERMKSGAIYMTLTFAPTWLVANF